MNDPKSQRVKSRQADNRPAPNEAWDEDFNDEYVKPDDPSKPEGEDFPNEPPGPSHRPPDPSKAEG